MIKFIKQKKNMKNRLDDPPCVVIIILWTWTEDSNLFN